MTIVHTLALDIMKEPKREEIAKDPHAVAMAQKRISMMSPERRSEIARNAARARWRKRKNKKKK